MQVTQTEERLPARGVLEEACSGEVVNTEILDSRDRALLLACLKIY
jgi:hypothetical protein